MNFYELEARYDARKSFYGKAHVVADNGIVHLYSYEVEVARIMNGQLDLLPEWNYSQTTRRHVNEFVKQYRLDEQYAKLKKEMKNG